MGQPGTGNAVSAITEYIGYGSDTQGSETSQYLEEKKSKRDSASSGERTRNSLNQPVYRLGLRDSDMVRLTVSRTDMERSSRRG